MYIYIYNNIRKICIVKSIETIKYTTRGRGLKVLPPHGAWVTEANYSTDVYTLVTMNPPRSVQRGMVVCRRRQRSGGRRCRGER